MKTNLVLVASLTIALVLTTLGMTAAAQNTAPATPPAAKADVKAEVTGRVLVKTIKKENTEVKETSILVQEAKDSEGKELAALKNKSLKVVGANAAAVEKLSWKPVIAQGTIKANQTEIAVASVTEKPQTTANKPPRKHSSDAQTAPPAK